MDRLEAKKATKNGAIAGCIFGAANLAAFFSGIYTNAEEVLGLWHDPLVFFDVLIILACAYGIYNKSRSAAVLLFLYFILGRIVFSIQTAQTPNIFLPLVFLYFNGKAIQGAFVYHKFEKTENPNYKTPPKWIYFTALTVLLIVAALWGYGLLMMTGTMP